MVSMRLTNDEGSGPLAGFSILKPLGYGAGSVIYKVRRENDNALLAIKYVRVKKRQDINIVRHLENEYAVLRALHRSDPPPGHIVCPVSCRRKRKLCKTLAAYLVMEYVKGRNLLEKHDYSMGRLLRILPQISRALLSIHDKGYVHGDLKPDNILVDTSLRIKLIDFGFAAPVGSSVNGVKGTVGYLAPEQHGGALKPETDVFNFGATMYWLTTGEQLPFIAAPDNDRKVIPDRGFPVVPPITLNENIPAGLSELITRCCADDPLERPAMRVVQNKLDEIAMPYEIGIKQ